MNSNLTPSSKRVFVRQLEQAIYTEWKRIEETELLYKGIEKRRFANAEIIENQFPSVFSIFERLFLKTPTNPFSVIYNLVKFLNSATAEDLEKEGLSAHQIIEILEEEEFEPNYQK